MRDLTHHFLLALAGLIYRHPRCVVAVASVLTIAAVVLTVTRLTLVHNVNSLISTSSPVHQNYLAYKKEFGVEEDYIVVIRSDDVERNREVARAVGERLRSMPEEVHRVLDRLDFKELERRFLLFLPLEDLAAIREEVRSTARALREAPRVSFDLNSMLDQAQAKFNDRYLREAKNWVEFKPFVERFAALLDALAEELEKSPAVGVMKKSAAAPVPSSGAAQGQLTDLQRLLEENQYLSFDEGKLLIVTAAPRQVTEGEAPYGATIRKIRGHLAELRQLYPEVSLGLTGEPVLNDDELTSSSDDSVKAGVLSFVLVAVLFFLAYREMSRPALCLVVLAMGVGCSLGFTVLTIGHLNLISQAFVAMVIGLGIDFGIQMMGRYEEELARGRHVREAIESTLGHTGGAIITGGSTTALAFFTMCFNDFVGLREFGVIAGGGIFICLVLSLTVLPALYVWRDRSRAQEELSQQARASHWHSSAFLNDLLLRRPRLVLAMAAVVTVAAAWQAQRVPFDYNLLNLQNPELESVREELALVNSSTNAVNFAVSIADSLEHARERIAAFQQLSTVATTRSLIDLFPEGQEEKLVVIREIVGELKGLNLNTSVSNKIDVARSQRELAAFLAMCREGKAEAAKFARLHPRAREAATTFDRLIPPLERSLAAFRKLDQKELERRFARYQLMTLDAMRQQLAWLSEQATDRVIEPEDIPAELLARYRAPNGRLLVEVLPRENVWDREPNIRFVEEIRQVDPNIAGTPVQNYEYIELLRASYVEAAWMALGAILVIVLLLFRSLKLTLLALLPLFIGILWTLGWMGASVHAFNPANVILLPLVIGIGVAYGVYTVDRFREEGRVNLFANSTGKAVILSALTTTIGFGSMMISSYRGLYSLGLLMTVGILMCMMASLLVLPQALALLSSSQRREQ